MELPPKIQLPPKTVRQQITGTSGKRPDVAKIPLSAARPMPHERKGIPPLGTISKPRQESTEAPTPQPSPAVPNPAPASASDSLPSPAMASPVAVTPAVAQPAQTQSPPEATAALMSEATSGKGDGNPPAKAPVNAIQKPLESLPVLSAFQQFLENEREVMKKRLVVLSASYLLALLLIVGITVAGGMIMVKRLRGDFHNIRSEVAKLAELSTRNRTDADTLSARISSETTKIRTELIPAASDEIRNKVMDKVGRHDEKLGKMDQLVQVLQKENSDMKTNMDLMQTRWMNVTNDMMAALAKFEHMQQTVASNREFDQPQAPEPTRLVSSSSAMSLTISPRGVDRSFEWRMPIPE